MSDLLNMDHINRLPQPFIATMLGGSRWPVHDIDVQTGLLRIDVMGLLDVLHVADVVTFTDAEGVDHSSDSFYLEDNAEQMNTPVARSESPNAVSPDILVPIAGSAPGQ